MLGLAKANSKKYSIQLMKCVKYSVIKETNLHFLEEAPGRGDATGNGNGDGSTLDWTFSFFTFGCFILAI